MSGGDGYRCDACRGRKNRCDACRQLRAEYKRTLRERKRAEGTCIECDQPALEGLRRCERHRADNAERSGEAHALRRGMKVG